ncbi:MAG: zf-HC2 domain-containing protein [Abditibacteriaceae bacterium]
MDTKADDQETECHKVSDALSAHFDGVANEAENQLAMAHLVDCSACTQMWREWQSLRLMELRALESVPSGEMLPLAPVKVPRHLKTAILQQTVSKPIWQRLWPRLLTGMAIPTFAVACWLLIVATPWQQSIPEMNSQQDPIAKNRVAMNSNESTSTPPSMINKNLSKGIVDRTEKSNSTNATKSVVAPTINNNISSPTRQAESRSDSIAPRIQKTTRMAAANSNAHSVKSTFKAASSSETFIVKSPRISMVSFDRPRSRVAKLVIKDNAKPMNGVAPKPRATEPVSIAYRPTQEMSNSTEAPSDPVLNYIAQNDVRPDDIRQAVENYRAALLDDDSNL